MAKCEFCDKGVTFGIQVSHSHRRSNRTWKPNVKRVKAIVKGTPTHVYVCTRCLRSGKVTALCDWNKADKKPLYHTVQRFSLYTGDASSSSKSVRSTRKAMKERRVTIPQKQFRSSTMGMKFCRRSAWAT